MTNRAPAAFFFGAALLISPGIAVAAFDQDLRLGSNGLAVIELQQFLIARKHLFLSDATGYFGQLTLAAVKEFQNQERIDPRTGFFGPLTRARALALLGNSKAGQFTSGSVGVEAQIAELLAKVQQLQALASTINGEPAPISPHINEYNFEASPVSGKAPLLVRFTATVPDGNESVHRINFGDGSAPGNPESVTKTNCILGHSCPLKYTFSHTYQLGSFQTLTRRATLYRLIDNGPQTEGLAEAAITLYVTN